MYVCNYSSLLLWLLMSDPLWHMCSPHIGLTLAPAHGVCFLWFVVLLQWTAHMQKQEGTYPRQSSAERKEALYNDIVEYFDKGKVCFI